MQPRDEVAFKRVVNKPSRGIGETSVDILLDAADSTLGAFGADLLSASAGAADSLKGKARAGIGDFLRLISGLREILAPAAGRRIPLRPRRAPRAKLRARRVPSRPGRGGWHAEGGQPRGARERGLPLPAEPRGPRDFLETIELDRSLTAEEAASADAVTLITMHNTKGLEFPVVIVTGLEQGLFPRDDEEGEDLEEQRRLFYVAVTRAKDVLHLSCCHWRRLHGRLYETAPSRFLTEIDGSLIQAADKGRAGPASQRDAYQRDAYPRDAYPRGAYPRDAAGDRAAKGRGCLGRQGRKSLARRTGRLPRRLRLGRRHQGEPHAELGPPRRRPLRDGQAGAVLPKFTTKLEAAHDR